MLGHLINFITRQKKMMNKFLKFNYINSNKNISASLKNGLFRFIDSTSLIILKNTMKHAYKNSACKDNQLVNIFSPLIHNVPLLTIKKGFKPAYNNKIFISKLFNKKYCSNFGN